MSETSKLKEEISHCFSDLRENIDKSFILMKNNPNTKDEMIEIWKKYVVQFIGYTFNESEKYGNKEVFKEITKALIFGK
ncbi:MAG: hypothetical protein N2484_17205 [Clostridia bacterium]|nr:hypothetical protein [Clostridia bacterium]